MWMMNKMGVGETLYQHVYKRLITKQGYFQPALHV